MRVFQANKFAYLAIVESPSGRKIEDTGGGLPTPLCRFVSFDETFTTFTGQGRTFTLHQTFDKDGKLKIEDVQSPAITEFRDLLKLGKEGYRRDEWDREHARWEESSHIPTVWQWEGASFLELESVKR